MLAVIDYGAGNLRSVLHALTFLGVESMRVVRSPLDLKGAAKIILPVLAHSAQVWRSCASRT